MLFERFNPRKESKLCVGAVTPAFFRLFTADQMRCVLLLNALVSRVMSTVLKCVLFYWLIYIIYYYILE